MRVYTAEECLAQVNVLFQKFLKEPDGNIADQYWDEMIVWEQRAVNSGYIYKEGDIPNE